MVDVIGLSSYSCISNFNSQNNILTLFQGWKNGKIQKKLYFHKTHFISFYHQVNLAKCSHQ